MTTTNRTMQLGRTAELREQLKTLSVEIDNAVKGIILHFEPMDLDMQYIEKIRPDRLKILVALIDRKKKIFDRISAEIKHLETETGETNSAQ